MKRINLFVVCVLTLLLSGCGGVGNMMTNSANNDIANNAGSILGDIIGSVTSKTNENTIVGTWVYKEPAVQMSSDNILASATSSIANKQAESKLKSYYEKLGIKAGTFTFTFNKDKTCSYNIKGKEYTGTYEFDSSNNKISINSNGLLSLPSAYAKVSGKSLELTFETSSLLNIAKGASSAVSGASTAAGALSTILGAYSGMKTGFNFTKK